MTSDLAVSKLSSLKSTCRNAGMTFAPEDIEAIQVFIIEQEKRFKDIRFENIKLVNKNKKDNNNLNGWLKSLGYNKSIRQLVKESGKSSATIYNLYKKDKVKLEKLVKGIGEK